MENKNKFFFNSLVKKFPFHPQWLINKQPFFLEQLKKLKDKKLLDIGCADRWVEKILPGCCSYIGIDYPNTGEKLYGARPDIFADASNLPIATETFDIVTLFEVLEHLEKPQDALQEAFRVLRPGGYLYLTMPFLYPIHDAPFDFQRYTEFGLKRELGEVGFSEIKIYPQLNAIKTACLLTSIAFGGSLYIAIRRNIIFILLAPIVITLIFLINIAGAFLSKAFSNWPGITSGYALIARKNLN